jgi:predicted nucleic acid-binding protein
MKYLVDTSIWIDLYEDRRGYGNEPLGDYAFHLFLKLKSQEDRIVLTDVVLLELGKKYSLDQIRGMLKPFEKILDKLISTKRQGDEAREIAILRNLPAGDALLAILARDNNLILVSRDKHFNALSDLAKHYKPENII